jgi:hypothetical protein
LRLPESAGRAFPFVLDYMYGGRDHLVMTDETAVAMQYLADYLQIPTLLPITADYVRTSLTASNVHIYCREALTYNVDWVVQRCVQLAAYSPEDLTLPAAVTNVDLDSGEGTNTVTDPTTAVSLSPVRQVLTMLPPQRQIELLQLSLTKAVEELKRFKRVPSDWARNVDDARATHVPTLLRKGCPLQGSSLPFLGRVCPVFYFEGGGPDNSLDVGNVHDHPFTGGRSLP